MKLDDKLLEELEPHFPNEVKALKKMVEGLEGIDFGQIEINVTIMPMGYANPKYSRSLKPIERTYFEARLIGNPSEIVISQVSLPNVP